MFSINLFLLAVEGPEGGRAAGGGPEGRGGTEALEYDAAGAVRPLQSPETRRQENLQHTGTRSLLV